MESARRYSAVSWRYRGDLPLEKLQNNTDVSCHASLQSGGNKRKQLRDAGHMRRMK